MSKAKVVERMITGGAVMFIPGTEMEAMWVGPGSHGILLGYPRQPRGFVVPINHSTCDHSFATLKEALDALDLFIDAADKEEQV